MRPLYPFLAAVSLVACSSGPGGGLRVTLDFSPSTAQCARVVVTGKITQQTAPLARHSLPSLVGVAPSAELGSPVNVEAFGWEAADCTGPITATARGTTVGFPTSGITEVPLRLEALNASDGGTDAGSDGGEPDGGTDAGVDGGTDGGPLVEACANGTDDDGDGLADCDDPDCLAQNCGGAKFCVSPGVCQVPVTEVNCADGTDDDGDGLVDCADSDCNQKPCNDLDACTTGEKCNALGQCIGGAQKQCPAPPVCQASPATCAPATGVCSYQPSTGGACDGGTCQNGTCRLDFSYPPTNFNPKLDPSLAAGPTTLDCGVSTFNSATNAFGNWCGRPTPIPVVVSQFLRDDVVVLAMRGFTLAPTATLRLTGDKAVILAVYGDADVQGFISGDAVKTVAGPGGSSNCLTASGGDGFFLTAAGGGGAGFSSGGSNGGAAYGAPLSGGPGGTQIGGLTFPDPIRGGCSGGDGAATTLGGSAAPGGGGGGAVQLSVAGQLTVSGRISVAGGGGRGAIAIRAGGGGGGSGGGVLLEALVLRLNATARVLANGGGGGGASEDSSGGSDGEDGHSTDATGAAGGTGGGVRAGVGGSGGASTASTAGEVGNQNGGGNKVGGGGGGGASGGRIRLRGVNACTRAAGATVSPGFTGACP